VSNHCQTKNSKRPKKSVHGWDTAIADAKERIRQLKLTVQVYEARKRAGDEWPSSEVSELAASKNAGLKNGDPWPGEAILRPNSESCHGISDSTESPQPRPAIPAPKKIFFYFLQ
jgi:hypothetical protein